MDMSSNMFDRKVPDQRPDAVFPLPLNLIALIISFLDRPSDLGRMCRTCRVFHYMTLPQLYSNVSLRSYDYIRYCEHDGRPEGCGMGSPFSMGLNGLVSRNVSSYVRSFEVCGEWKEHELAEHAKVGRVPDGSMFMNTLVRVAIERMPVLKSFSWELNTKMLPTIWQGLAQKNTLRRLTIKFPNKRDPRPMAVAPPLPNLEYLNIHDIDPLCYADDISLMLLGSKNLKHLKMHWSPRMRNEHEPSVHPSAYFGKIEAAQYTMRLKSIAICNLFALNNENCGAIFDTNLMESATMLNSSSGLGDGGGAAFMERENWREASACIMPNLRTVRLDKVSRAQCHFIGNMGSLEHLYLVGPQARSSITSKSTSPILPQSPASSTSSPSSNDSNSILSLKDSYLEVITKSHGPTLKHLLLLPQWRLTEDDVAMIVRSCPNLEQLALGVEFSSFKHLRLLIPFLSKLTSVRLLANPDDPTFADKMRELDRKGRHEEKLADETVNEQWSHLRLLEVGGDDMIFEVGKRYLAEERDKEGKQVWRRSVRKVPRGRVDGVEIWGMDCLNI